MATFSGVISYTPSTGLIRHYTTYNSSLNQNSIHSIRADSKDRIWIGTKSGVCFYDALSDSIRPIDILPASIGNCKITYIYEDRNTNIWICTETDGLYSIHSDLTKYEHYTTDNYLPDNSVVSIMEDELGFFWVATHKGLVKCTFADHTCHTFWLSDGLPGLMFNPGACFSDRLENKLWWGNENGLVYAHSRDRHTNMHIPPLKLTHFYMNGEEMTTAEPVLPKVIDRCTEIKLSKAQSSVGFGFIALDYIYPNDNIYETMLDGYEHKWQTLDRGKTSVYYRNISPGKYTFRVRLAAYPESEKTLGVVITHQGNAFVWLIPLCALFFAGIFYWKRKKPKREQLTDTHPKTTKKEPAIKDSKLKQQALLRLMEEKKPYLDPDLKLSWLATALKCTPVELSQLFKVEIHKNFSDFVNEYRVDEFKKRVSGKEHEKYTIFALAEQCGFNSRSSFFRIFKKVTGLTPTEYFKQIERS
jgi:AraC-like DNA-binding protein